MVIPGVDAATVAGAMLENMHSLGAEADVRQRHQMLASMLDAVLLDPQSRSVVGLVPRPAFRQVFLNVNPRDGVIIFGPMIGLRDSQDR